MAGAQKRSALPRKRIRRITGVHHERVDTVGTNPLLACSYGGDSVRRMATCGLQKRFANLAKHAGIPTDKHHLHAMRHGFATRMLFDTKTIGGIYTVSKLLGHSRVAVTEMYLHCSQDQLEQASLADPLGAGV